MAIDPSQLLDVFGYPPDNLEPITTKMIQKSMPVVSFYPSEPEFQSGLDLFTLRDAWGQYEKLLKNNGFKTPNGKGAGIKLAFLADNFPTDSFTNEYGENFLQGLTNIASEGAASIAQIMGAKSATEAYNKFASNLGRSDNVVASLAGTAMEGFGDIAGTAWEALGKIPGLGKTVTGGGSVLNKLAAGGRLDFPMVWKSSAYQPSYSFTVRLYNPFPQDKDYTQKYIVGPIVAMMLLGVPRAQDSSTFTWPFLHKISCPGLFYLPAGYISNITVVKGGDQQQISMQQRLGVVDVRIDVGSLYSSMLAGSNLVTSQRPTVKQYAEAMLGEKEITSRLADNAFVSRFATNLPEGRDIGVDRNRAEAIRLAGRTAYVPNANFSTTTQVGDKKVSPKVSAKANDPSLTDRVSTQAKNIYEQLKGLVA